MELGEHFVQGLRAEGDAASSSEDPIGGFHYSAVGGDMAGGLMHPTPCANTHWKPSVLLDLIWGKHSI